MALHIDIKEDALYQLGKEATALHLLKEGFPPEAVARFTELPLARIVHLKLEPDASRISKCPFRQSDRCCATIEPLQSNAATLVPVLQQLLADFTHNTKDMYERTKVTKHWTFTVVS